MKFKPGHAKMIIEHIRFSNNWEAVERKYKTSEEFMQASALYDEAYMLLLEYSKLDDGEG